MRSSGRTANWIKIVALSLTMLFGCDDGTDSAQSYTVRAAGGKAATSDAAGAALCQSFSAQLLVKDRMNQQAAVFNTGEEIRFELQVTNNSDTSQTLNAAASCFTEVFEVVDRNGIALWNNISGIFCFAPHPPTVFQPRQTLTYSATWEQQSRAINPPMEPSSAPECRSALIKSAQFEIR
jgi:hypothetical protein